MSLSPIKNNMKPMYEKKKNGILFFDTETTGLPQNWYAPVDDLNNWPRLVQIAWILCDSDGTVISQYDSIISPEGFSIPQEVSLIHGITTDIALREGSPLAVVLSLFQQAIDQSAYIVAHNISFDEMIVGAEFLRNNMPNSIATKQKICTKERSTTFCAIPRANGLNDYKWPKLSELCEKLFGTKFEDFHNALADVNATAKCFWEMKKRGIL